MNDPILEFIHRRFPVDCGWMSGNCYYFAKILCDRFHTLEIYYLPIEGHFVARNKLQDYYYDYAGKHNITSKILKLYDIRYSDPEWYMRLVRDCMN